MTDSVKLTKTQAIMASSIVKERERVAAVWTDCNQAVTEFIELMRITHGMPPGEYGISGTGVELVLARIEEEENDDSEGDSDVPEA